MTTRVKLEILGGVLGLIIGFVALWEHDNHVRLQAAADATKAAQDVLQKQLAQQAADFDAKLKARDTQYATDSKNLTDQFAVAAKNEATMMALLQKLTGAPQPFVISTPAPTAANPNPQPVVTVPSVDFPAVQQYAQACETCKLSLAKAQADAEDRLAQMALAQKTIESLKTERDTALVAARGGTTLQRTWHDGKLIAIGGAVAIVVACALGHCPR